MINFFRKKPDFLYNKNTSEGLAVAKVYFFSDKVDVRLSRYGYVTSIHTMSWDSYISLAKKIMTNDEVRKNVAGVTRTSSEWRN